MSKVLIATYSWSGRTESVAQKLKQVIEDADMYKIEAPDILSIKICIRLMKLRQHKLTITNILI